MTPPCPAVTIAGRKSGDRVMVESALEVRGLRKVFTRPAVDNLDLTVRAGMQ